MRTRGVLRDDNSPTLNLSSQRRRSVEEEEIQCLKSFEIITEILNPGKTLNPNSRGGGGGAAGRGFVGSFCCWLWSKSVAAILGVIARRRELDCALLKDTQYLPKTTQFWPIPRQQKKKKQKEQKRSHEAEGDRISRSSRCRYRHCYQIASLFSQKLIIIPW